MPSKDPVYDPTKAPPTDRWYDEPQAPPPDPYARQFADPRYSFAPPPPAYAQYPPPIYANPYGYPTHYPQPVSPSYAMAGGVLTLVAGVIGLISAVVFWGGLGFFWWFGDVWCMVYGVIMSVMGIIGGTMAMMRRVFPLAVIGAVCGMISGGGFYGISFILGLLGLIFILIGKDTFLPSVQYPGYYRY